MFHPFCHIGKVKKELDHEDSHLNLDETARLLQDLHEAQAERGGSRPSSNLSSLSTASEREHPPPGKGLIQVSSGDPHWVEDRPTGPRWWLWHRGLFWEVSIPLCIPGGQNICLGYRFVDTCFLLFHILLLGYMNQ